MKNVKSTKKSMFVATLLIVVLLIAAVATATFAWFTQQDTVTAGGTQVIAAQATGASLGIGWDHAQAVSVDPHNHNIDFQQMTAGGLLPMAPTAVPELGVTTLGEFRAMTEAFVDMDGYFLQSGRAIEPYRLAEAGGVRETFSIANNAAAAGGQAIDGIILTTTGITGTLASEFRMAVFVNGFYAGTIATAAGAPTAAGAIVESANQTSLTPYAATVVGGAAGLQLLNGEGSIPSSLAAQGSITVEIVAWFDGRLLTNARSAAAVAAYASDSTPHAQVVGFQFRVGTLT